MKLKSPLYTHLSASALITVLLSVPSYADNNDQSEAKSEAKSASKIISFSNNIDSSEVKASRPALNKKGHFFIKEGNKKRLCQDFVGYMNNRVDRYLAIPRYFIESEGFLVLLSEPL
jgi:hypothetical protein